MASPRSQENQEQLTAPSGMEGLGDIVTNTPGLGGGTSLEGNTAVGDC